MSELEDIELGGARYTVDVLDLPAPEKGQDAYLTSDGFAGVADGSTPLLASVPTESVASFAGDVLAALCRHADQPRAQMVEQALAELGSPSVSVERGVSSTAAVVRAGSDGLEAGVLGDCLVVARSASETVTLTDARLDPYDTRAAEQLAAAIRNGVDEAAAQESINDLLVSNRRLANKPGHYWLITGDKRAATEWRWSRLPHDAEAILLCSDGFSRLVDPLAEYADEESLLRAAETDGLDALGRRLRARENAPDSLIEAPRLSRHDDATAVLLRLAVG